MRIVKIGPDFGSKRCPGCDNKPCRMRWVIEVGSGYANDPFGATAALSRAHRPVSTQEERDAAKRSKVEHRDAAKQLVPTRRGYGVTIPNEAEWIAVHARSGKDSFPPSSKNISTMTTTGRARGRRDA